MLPDFFLLFSSPCSADHERDWPPCKVVFRVGNQYAECEKQQQTTYEFTCMVTHIARVWINRVRLAILLVVSRTRKMSASLSPFVPENLVLRDGFSRPVPRQPAHLHTQVESIWCLLTGFLPSSAVVSIYLIKPPYAIGLVPSLAGHAIAYRCPLLRVHRHRASKPQGSSKRMLPWQVTMDQLICASLSHTLYMINRLNSHIIS